jgi:hypothetical protein
MFKIGSGCLRRVISDQLPRPFTHGLELNSQGQIDTDANLTGDVEDDVRYMVVRRCCPFHLRRHLYEEASRTQAIRYRCLRSLWLDACCLAMSYKHIDY